MPSFRTHGVYIEEISKLPASVAPVSTAIPAFIGYTERRVRDREEIPLNTPVRITSLLEFEEIFGRPFSEDFHITLTGDIADSVIEIDPSGDEHLSPYTLYYALKLFFQNGGGDCYVVSVGDYEDEPDLNSIDSDELLAGLNALETEDEPTLIVTPEAVYLNEADRGELYKQMLSQSARLKDRFTLLDVVEKQGQPLPDADDFRESVGMDNLGYGAAYYPALKTSILRYYSEDAVRVTDKRTPGGEGRFHGLSLGELSEGSRAVQGIITIHKTDALKDGGDLVEGVEIIIGGHTFVLDEPEAGETRFELEDGDSEIDLADKLVDAINSVSDSEGYSAERKSGRAIIIVRSTSGEDVDVPFTYTGPAEAISISGEGEFGRVAPDKTLYNRIKKALDKKRLTLYPSAAMAGVYSRVDRDRGVWKAPANVSLNLVRDPSVLLTDDEQAPLNVDADTGKSVNVIRRFNKRGTVVWGARTLAGNDNEWRFIPVRRLFIFIEESIRRATEPVVFEPNDANTWTKTKAMIENFLEDLWREGALAGASPDEAFFVRTGLGQTMTSTDILEGKMIVEIGIAAVRPAEFIILQFMHKLQES